jgi:hypothetical protein
MRLSSSGTHRTPADATLAVHNRRLPWRARVTLRKSETRSKRQHASESWRSGPRDGTRRSLAGPAGHPALRVKAMAGVAA